MVAQRDTGIGQSLQRFLYFDGQLARMIHVHAYPKRMMFREHRAKIGRDALRQKNRDTRADAEELDVRDGAQALQDAFEFIVAEDVHDLPRLRRL